MYWEKRNKEFGRFEEMLRRLSSLRSVLSEIIKILEQRRTPPAIFVNHQLVTPQNVDSVYPNDPLLSAANLDSLMLQSV